MLHLQYPSLYKATVKVKYVLQFYIHKENINDETEHSMLK